MTTDAAGPLQRLSALGQSVWIDFLSREAIRGGRLQELIDDYAVVGATSNPTILQKAMTGGEAYDEQLHELLAQGLEVEETFWALAEQDIREACDVFRGTWEGGGERGSHLAARRDQQHIGGASVCAGVPQHVSAALEQLRVAELAAVEHGDVLAS